jgi:hypothetical protein
MAYSSAALNSISVPRSIFERDASHEIVRKDLWDQAFVLYNVLSSEECKFFIDEMEKMEQESLCWDKPVLYRKNNRCMVMSKDISDFIWKRVGHLLKGSIDVEVKRGQSVMACPVGKWSPFTLNEKWRICKYFPSGLFGAHYDGSMCRCISND